MTSHAGLEIPQTITTIAGRPDVPALVEKSVYNTARYDRVIVATCGPASMMQMARNATAKCILDGDRSIVFYAERFGW